MRVRPAPTGRSRGTRLDCRPHSGHAAAAVALQASIRTVSSLASTDTTVTSATDGNNSSCSRSIVSFTAPNCRPHERRR
jgi:hypothetical protein